MSTTKKFELENLRDAVKAGIESLKSAQRRASLAFREAVHGPSNGRASQHNVIHLPATATGQHSLT